MLAACALFLAAGPAAGRIKAWTQGMFSVRYNLAAEGGAVRARTVRLRVRNIVCFRQKPTARLREHEAMHRRINEAEAARIQEEMRAFRFEGTDLGKAEAAFREAFYKRLEAVRELHRAWDANHATP